MQRKSLKGALRNVGERVKKFFMNWKITRIDRYIIYKFLSTYIFLIAIIILIAIIFDFNEKIDKFTQSHASVERFLWTTI